jgi:hypothetical protein
MRALFVVGAHLEAETAFKLATKMFDDGNDVFFLFVGERCRYALDEPLMRSLFFAAGIYCLDRDLDRNENCDGGSCEVVDYTGWVELIESCDTLFSWF